LQDTITAVFDYQGMGILDVEGNDVDSYQTFPIDPATGEALIVKFKAGIHLYIAFLINSLILGII
jgi:hypothetical protein